MIAGVEAVTLYHGTRRGFGRGGVVMPRSFHGGAGTSAPVTRHAETGAESWVYVTGSLELAWAYAWHAAGRGKPKVLVVEPRGELEPDPEHSAAMDAWRCEWAVVRQVLTDPAISEAEARTGWVVEPGLR